MIKICGITNQEDADAAVEGGANALGFNFYSGSPRYITPDRAAAIQSPAGVSRVGVFVDEAPAQVAAIARAAALDVAQLHGNETPADYPEHLPVWKAVRLAFDSTAPTKLHSAFQTCRAFALLIDGPASGQTFAWILAGTLTAFRSEFELRPRVIVAGGLDASNVEQAVAAALPWGVDACSRIESTPGRKDHKKMQEFLSAARKALKR